MCAPCLAYACNFCTLKTINVSKYIARAHHVVSLGIGIFHPALAVSIQAFETTSEPGEVESVLRQSSANR